MPVRYVFKPITKTSAGQYDGFTLTTKSVRIATRAATRFAGVGSVQLGDDAKANAPCLRPVKAKEDRALEPVSKLSKRKSASLLVAGPHFGGVMPAGRYRFAKTLSTGAPIFIREGEVPVKQA